jgi:hypothetical protein
MDRLCGRVVRVPGSKTELRFDSRVYQILWEIESLERGYLEEKVAAPVQKTENMAARIRRAGHVAPFFRKSWH